MWENDLTNLIGINIEEVEEPSTDDLVDKYVENLVIEDKQGKRIINENVFAHYYVEYNHLSYSNGLFFTRTGKVSEEMILKDIQATVEELNISTSVAATCKKILDVVRIVATKEKIEPNPDIIPFANGDLYYKEKVFRMGSYSDSPYRLSVPLIPTISDVPYFSKWLKEILYDEDIRPFQMALGSALVYETKTQKSYYMVGQGGAGKSVIGVILQGMLGNAMISTPSTQDFVKDKFKVAELENKLCLYDDDMDNDALSNSGLYKKIITNELYITADRKYGQPFEFKPKVKIFACCNEFIVPESDTTDGFYRRLHPFVIKPKPKDFKPDKNFYDKIRSEIDYITLWAVQGLMMLIDNNWEIPESERTKNYITQKKFEANPLPAFMEDNFIFTGEENDTIPTEDIYNLYRQWCRDNCIEADSRNKVSTWISSNVDEYEIEYSKNIKLGDKYLRGYRGLKRKTGNSKIIKLYDGAYEPQ